VSTEDLIYLLDGMGVEHGVDLDGIMEASRFIVDAVGHPLRSKVFQVGGRLRLVAAPR
jgi:hydroxymethylglutaryl-CoA lyase